MRCHPFEKQVVINKPKTNHLIKQNTKDITIQSFLSRIKDIKIRLNKKGKPNYLKSFPGKIFGLAQINPFPKDKFLNLPNSKEFADDNFKSDENGRKFSKRVENTEGKGEIARYEQFLLFPQCFQKTCTADT